VSLRRIDDIFVFCTFSPRDILGVLGAVILVSEDGIGFVFRHSQTTTSKTIRIATGRTKKKAMISLLSPVLVWLGEKGGEKKR